jgi:hypothetical protein
MAIDVSTIDGIISAFYDIVSIPKGEQRRWEDDLFIHCQNPHILLPIGPGGSFVQMTISEYHAQSLSASPGRDSGLTPERVAILTIAKHFS